MSPKNKSVPHLQKEIALLKQGYYYIAGLDEAGRGAWAGPVVAAAVILPLNESHLLEPLAGLRDSKKLSPAKREQFFETITQHAVAVATGTGSPQLVDEVNVVQATRHAMRQALARLAVRPDYLLLDHLRLPTVELPQDAFSKADNISLTVAAASVVAKVTRDRLMVAHHHSYPAYAFDRHKGYGTHTHRTALAKYGPSPLHRMSYRPIKILALNPDD